MKKIFKTSGICIASMTLLISGCSNFPNFLKKEVTEKTNCPSGFVYIGNGYCRNIQCYNSNGCIWSQDQSAVKAMEENGLSCPITALCSRWGDQTIPAN